MEIRRSVRSFLVDTKMRIVLMFVLVGLGIDLLSQCPYNIPLIEATLCSSSPMPITGIDNGLTDYSWIFGYPELSGLPAPVNLGNPGVSLSSTFGMTVIEEDSVWFGFVKKVNAETVFRYDFGNSLLNVPIVTELGVNSFLNSTSLSDENIEILKIAGNWYGFTTIRQNPAIIRYEFGPSLNTDTLVATNLGNPGAQLSLPVTSSVAVYQDSLFIVVGDNNNTKLVVYNYGTNPLSVIPVWMNAESLGIGSPAATGITCSGVYANCGKCVAFAGGSNTDNLIRLDYGNSFSNTPVRSQIGSAGSWVNPWNLNVLVDGGNVELMAKAYNSSANLIHAQFLDSVDQPSTSVIVNSITSSASLTNGLCLEFATSADGVIAFAMRNNDQLYRFHYPYQNGVVDALYGVAAPEPDFAYAGKYRYSINFSDSLGSFLSYTDSIDFRLGPTVSLNLSNFCFGDSIDLNATSIGPTIDSSKWIFGNVVLANVFDTSLLNAVSGFSEVSFISAANGCSDTLDTTIYIYSAPDAEFTIDTSCQGLPVAYSNLSSIDSMDTIHFSVWKMGNGDVDTSFIPDYSYPMAGTYKVKLQITTGGGCTSFDSANVLIKETPLADFDFSSTCFGDSMNFQNNSSSSFSFTTLWSFGDGLISNLQSPKHFYADTGDYLVNLLTQSSNGCHDSNEVWIRVSPKPEPHFTINSPACQSQLLDFTDLSQSIDPITARTFQINDDTFDLMQGMVLLSDSGMATSGFIVTAGSDCRVDTQFVVNVNPHPSLSVVQTGVCQHQLSTYYAEVSNLASQSVVQRSWWLNDSLVGLADSIQLIHDQSGYYKLATQLVTDSGCLAAYEQHYYTHKQPSISLNIEAPYCSRVPISYMPVFSLDSLDTIDTISWTISSGVGDSVFFGPEPELVFQDFGPNTISINLRSEKGCINSESVSINVFESPEIELYNDSACIGNIVEFSSNYSGTNYEWNWDFDDGSTSILSAPSHVFFASGAKKISAQILDKHSMCQDSTSSIMYVAEGLSILGINGTLCSKSMNVFEPEVILDTLDRLNRVDWKVNDFMFHDKDSIRLSGEAHGQPEMLSIGVSAYSSFGCNASYATQVPLIKSYAPSIDLSTPLGAPPFDVAFKTSENYAGTYSWIIGSDTLHGSENSYTITEIGKIPLLLELTDTNGCVSKASSHILSFLGRVDLGIESLEKTSGADRTSLTARIHNFSSVPVLTARVQLTSNHAPILNFDINDTLFPGQTRAFILPVDLALDLSEDQLICLNILSVNGSPDGNETNNVACLAHDQYRFFIPFPNPVSDFLVLPVMSKLSMSLKVMITNSNGRLIQSQSFETNSGYSELKVDFSGMSNGVYHLEVRMDDDVLYATSIIKL